MIGDGNGAARPASNQSVANGLLAPPSEDLIDSTWTWQSFRGTRPQSRRRGPRQAGRIWNSDSSDSFSVERERLQLYLPYVATPTSPSRPMASVLSHPSDHREHRLEISRPVIAQPVDKKS